LEHGAEDPKGGKKKGHELEPTVELKGTDARPRIGMCEGGEHEDHEEGGDQQGGGGPYVSEKVGDRSLRLNLKKTDTERVVCMGPGR